MGSTGLLIYQEAAHRIVSIRQSQVDSRLPVVRVQLMELAAWIRLAFTSWHRAKATNNAHLVQHIQVALAP